jgi:hypothetical protein
MLRVAAAIGLATIAFSAMPAQATTTILSDVGPGESSVYFGNSSTKKGAINDQFTFTIPNGSVSGFVGSIALMKNFDVILKSVTLDGLALYRQDLTGYEEKWSLVDTLLTKGTHVIAITGSWGSKGGSYSGTLNFSPAVPEPATWAMMISGLALVGAMQRSRRNTRIAFS